MAFQISFAKIKNPLFENSKIESREFSIKENDTLQFVYTIVFKMKTDQYLQSILT